VQCPTCKQIYGVKQGDCPPGTMTYRLINRSLSGYEDCHTIEITYDIRSGTQDGVAYVVHGFPRNGYLPHNDKGLQVLTLLAKAWERRLTFTVGTSVTTGMSNVVVWNEIHHKTSMVDVHGHGYPDPKYLDNVLGELTSQGITDD
jgi:deltex-like protein